MKKYMLITRDGRTYSSGVVRGVFDGKQLAVDTYIAHLRLGGCDDNFLSIARKELETTGRFHQFPFKDEIIEIEANKIIYEKI